MLTQMFQMTSNLVRKGTQRINTVDRFEGEDINLILNSLQLLYATYVALASYESAKKINVENQYNSYTCRLFFPRPIPLAGL